MFVDIFYVDSKPILHVVDESTRYQAAWWLARVSAEAVWEAMRMCWIDVYLGPPDIITHDAGKQFMARAFQTNAELLHIETNSVPVESANYMSTVERYHTPVRRAFKIIREEAPQMSAKAALQTAVKAVNDSVGPDGLVPTLLVYGALPRLGVPGEKPTPTTLQRAIALRKATAEMTKHFARRQVTDATRTGNGPDTSDIHNAPLNSQVFVYRPEIDHWTGPYRLLLLEGETCTVLLDPPAGPTKFRTTVVKRFFHEGTENGTVSASQSTPTAFTMTILPCGPSAFAFHNIPQSKDNEKYATSRKK